MADILHTYRLRFRADSAGEARDVEFEARGPDAALFEARDICGGRSADLYEDGRKLAGLKQVQGVWHVS